MIRIDRDETSVYTRQLLGNSGEEGLIIVSVPRQDGKTSYAVLQVSCDSSVELRNQGLTPSVTFAQEMDAIIEAWKNRE